MWDKVCASVCGMGCVQVCAGWGVCKCVRDGVCASVCVRWGVCKCVWDLVCARKGEQSREIRCPALGGMDEWMCVDTSHSIMFGVRVGVTVSIGDLSVLSSASVVGMHKCNCRRWWPVRSCHRVEFPRFNIF